MATKKENITVFLLLFLCLQSGFICNQSGTDTASQASTTTKKETTESKPITFLESTFSKWVAGIRDGGQGKDYYFKTLISTTEPIAFDSAWIADEGFKILIATEQGPINNTPIEYALGDTVLLQVSTHSQIDFKANSPINYEGAALLRYSINGKESYHVIDTIREVPTIHRP